jgi:hypothetical protein
MDETRPQGTMEPVVPLEIDQAAERICSYLSAAAYLTGGALLPHATHDYDILIRSALSDSDLLIQASKLYKETREIAKIVIHSAYGKSTDEWRAVIKLVYNGYDMDLLVMPGAMSIHEVLARYPLSIQKQALRIGVEPKRTAPYRHPDYTEHIIVVHKGGISYKKYRKYYPDKAFLVLPGVEV